MASFLLFWDYCAVLIDVTLIDIVTVVLFETYAAGFIENDSNWDRSFPISFHGALLNNNAYSSVFHFWFDCWVGCRGFGGKAEGGSQYESRLGRVQ